jgi:parallel beta-helix repeat protein
MLGSDGVGPPAVDSNITIESNLIRNNGNDGIDISASIANTRIVNNRIFSNYNGIDIFDPQAYSTYILNNTIVENSHNGVVAAETTFVYLVNNIISYNGTSSDTTGGRYGVYRLPRSQQQGNGPQTQGGPLIVSHNPYGNPAGIQLINNLVIENNGALYSGVSSHDLGNYPGILDSAGDDAGNYTTSGGEGVGVNHSSSAGFSSIFVSSSPINVELITNSVPVNAGVNSWSNPNPTQGVLPTTDFKGTHRPIGTWYCIGADEEP